MERRSALVVCGWDVGSQSNVHCYILHISNINKVNCDSTLKIFFCVHNCANLEVKVTSHSLMKSGCKLFCKYCF